MIRFWQGRAAGERDGFRAGPGAREAGRRSPRRRPRSCGGGRSRSTRAPRPPTRGSAGWPPILDQSHGDRKVEIGVSRARAGLEAMSGRFPEARELIAHAKALARELGDQVALAAVFRDAGHVEMLAGDPVAAEIVDRRGVRDPRAHRRSRPPGERRSGPGRRDLRPGSVRRGRRDRRVRRAAHDRGRRRRPGPRDPAPREGVGAARPVRGGRGGRRRRPRAWPRGPTTSSSTRTRS